VLPLLRQAISPELAQALRAAPFLLLLILGLQVARTRDPAARRRRVDALLLFLLAAFGVAAASQVDAWPFSPYRLMVVDARDHHAQKSMIAFRAVDAAGREWKVDPYAWSPLYPYDVMTWFELSQDRATQQERESVLSFLYERVERARRLRLAGRRVGNDRLLGPLTAPDMYVLPSEKDLSATPFVALRVYRLYWRSDELAADATRVQRRLLLESPPR